MPRSLQLFIVLVTIGWLAWQAFGPAQTVQFEIVSSYLVDGGAFDLSRAPIQISDNGEPIELEGVRLTPMARFSVDGMVLGSRRYSFDRFSIVAPVDVALAWGPLATDPRVDQFTIRQYRRFFFYRFGGGEVFQRESMIRNNASNMHLIPANSEVRDAIRDLRRGDRVRLAGRLVNVAHEGARWKTSMRRTDTGAGACEILLVESVVRAPGSPAGGW